MIRTLRSVLLLATVVVSGLLGACANSPTSAGGAPGPGKPAEITVKWGSPYDMDRAVQEVFRRAGYKLFSRSGGRYLFQRRNGSTIIQPEVTVTRLEETVFTVRCEATTWTEGAGGGAGIPSPVPDAKALFKDLLKDVKELAEARVL